MKKILPTIVLQFFLMCSGWSQCVSTCSAYAVSPITYSLYANNGTTLNTLFTPTTDDGTVSVPIGFNFDFYCNTYYDVIVCTNGFLQFDYGTPLSFGTPIYSHPPQAFPSTVTPNGLVALQMNDFDVTSNGSISYTTAGNAPNRQFILTYSNVPIWYNSVTNIPPSPLYNSGQIVLNETTNIIEIHTANIPISPYYGTQGIENTSGTIGAAPPGRNFAAWSGTNNAYQFSPFSSPAPSITVGSTTLCQGEVDFYQANFIPSATAYNWSFPPGWTGTSTLSGVTTTVGAVGTVSVNATYTCGISPNATLYVLVKPSPTVNITVTPNLICSGSTVTLNTSGAISYTVNPPGLSGLPTFTDSPYTTTVYSVSGTNSLGCISAKNGTVVVQVKITPTVSVDNGIICLGEVFNMNAQSTATSYTVLGVNGNFLSVTPTLAAQYSYTIIGNGGNGCISQPVVSSVTVNPLPVLTASISRNEICKGESVVLTVSGASTYSWSNTFTTPIFTTSPIANAGYTVVGTDALGCKNTAEVSVLVSKCTSLEQNKISSVLSIYPNPVDDFFNLSLNSDGKMTLKIYNSLSQLLTTEEIVNQNSIIHMSDFPSGIYYIKIDTDKGTEAIKLFKK